MLCVDPEHGGLEENDAIKTRLAAQEPYGRWLEDNLQSLDTGEPDDTVMPDLVARQSAFGYTKEEFTYVLRPMATQGKEPIFSMGDDTALSVLAQSPRLLYSYFKQRFAQVTNPPIDHLRERLVMSLRSYLGPPAPEQEAFRIRDQKARRSLAETPPAGLAAPPRPRPAVPSAGA